MSKLPFHVVAQQDQQDCGPACLLSVINFYKGSDTIENIRNISGTSVRGTTLLGLHHAAVQSGFEAEGCKTSMKDLLELNRPSILYVIIGDKQAHYVVFFGSEIKNNKRRLIIGDPAKGILYLQEDELQVIWTYGVCLLLSPGPRFKTAKSVSAEKRRWARQLIRQDLPLLSIAVGLGVLIATLGMAMAIFSQRLIDDILPGHHFAKLKTGIVLVFILLFLKEIISRIRQFFLIRQSKEFNIRISSFFYSHLLHLPKSFFDMRKIGELTARLNDTNRIQRVISQLAGNVIIDGLIAVVSLIFLFFYSRTVGIVCLFSMPAFYLLIHWYKRPIIGGQQSIMGSYAMAEANYISTLQGIESIKIYNKQSVFEDSNKKIFEDFQEKTFSLGIIQLRLSFLANAFGVIFLTGVLLFTSYQVMEGRLKAGELIAILGICGSLLPSVANLALIFIQIHEARVAFDRMFEFAGIEPEAGNADYRPDRFESLEICDLSFRFAGRSQLLKSVSFRVDKGEIIAILGENGSGKSTLSQILQKNYRPESGNIIINGDFTLEVTSLQEWRRLVGIVPQQVHIFNGSVIQNIAFEDAVSKTGEVLHFFREYGFADFIDSLPQSFMTLVGEQGINLSGGQKQMIALARALYHHPQLLILDEATAGMDRQSEQFVLQLISRLKARIAVVFITHRLHILKSFCDRIYILENGQITHAGNHRILLDSDNLYSAYWKDLR